MGKETNPDSVKATRQKALNATLVDERELRDAIKFLRRMLTTITQRRAQLQREMQSLSQ